MDTEQYEEAVRDYEKVYQTEKTKGKEVREHVSQGTVWPDLNVLELDLSSLIQGGTWSLCDPQPGRSEQRSQVWDKAPVFRSPVLPVTFTSFPVC